MDSCLVSVHVRVCQCVTKVECPNTPVETGHRSPEDIREVLNHGRSSDNVQTDELMLSLPHQKHFIQILTTDKPPASAAIRFILYPVKLCPNMYIFRLDENLFQF